MTTPTQTLIDFVNNWRTSHGIAPGVSLSEAQAKLFAADLLANVSTLAVTPSDPSGIRTWAVDARPILYDGYLGSTPAWQVAEAASHSSNGKYFFISDVPQPIYAL